MRTKAELIAGIRADQQLWRDLAAEVGPDRYDEPGPMGAWSFGDLAGHLAGWRNRTIARLQAFARHEPDPPPPWPAGFDDDDRVNDWIHSHDAGRSPAELVEAYTASYDQLIGTLELIPEAVLADPNAIPWLEGEAMVDQTFTGHLHDEHLPSVRAWLEDRAPSTRP